MNVRALFALLTPIIAVQAMAGTVTIVHLNDTHAHIEPTIIKGKPYGGFARIASKVAEIRKTEKNVLFLDAGDVFQGTLYFNMYGGLADGVLFNAMHLDAMCLGNHEFDNGPAGLLPFVRQAQFPILSCNLGFDAYPELKQIVKPWTILKAGTEEVGLIGVTTVDLPTISSPGDVKMNPLDPAIEQSIAELEAKGINKIILISHCGYGEEKEIARLHPKIDVIVGGHSHTLLGSLKIDGFANGGGAYPTKVGNTLLVSSWEWGKVLGHIVVDFDDNGNVTKYEGAPIPMDETIPEDPFVKGAIDAFVQPIMAMRKSIVGQASTDVTRGGGQNGESPLGDIIADSMLAATKEKYGTVIAMMNRGGIRSDINAGPISYEAAIMVQPFGNTLFVLDATGQEILDALNSGVDQGMEIQISDGFSYTVDRQQPKGKQVGVMMLNGKAIELDKPYRIVINNFMARGGDSFTSLANTKGYRYDTGGLDIDAFVTYLKAHNPLESKTYNRIRRPLR